MIIFFVQFCLYMLGVLQKVKSKVRFVNYMIFSKAGVDNQSVRIDWVRQSLKGLPANSRILDAGAGELLYKKFCSHLEYVSQDIAEYDGSGDGVGLQCGDWNTTSVDIRSDITAIPEDDGSFDAVMCIEVFEHLPDPLLALKEFNRLLRKGGTLLLTAPFCSLTHQSPYYFYSGFSRYFYETHLLKNGFDIVEITMNGNYFEYMAQELRRLRWVANEYAKSDLRKGEQRAVKKILKLLVRLSGKDHGSDNLLCYGYHVLARKK